MNSKLSVSKAALMNVIGKLNLQPGDIILCKDLQTLHAIEALGKVVNFMVPIVYAPFGIQKLTRQDLLNLLEQLDQPAPTNSAPVESNFAPL